MDPVTKADLKDTFNELRAEWRNDIKSTVAAEFASWKPAIDSQIADLHEAVDLLQKQHVDGKTNDAGEASAIDHPDQSARKSTSSTDGTQTREYPRADGHGVASSPQTVVDGFLTSPPVPPANGTVNGQLPLPAVTPAILPAGQLGNLALFFASNASSPPSMPFPVFDGENSLLWKDLCEQYFSVYGIQELVSVQMATLIFSPTTAIWLQSVRKKSVRPELGGAMYSFIQSLWSRPPSVSYSLVFCHQTVYFSPGLH